jgi:hypothetical protein
LLLARTPYAENIFWVFGWSSKNVYNLMRRNDAELAARASALTLFWPMRAASIPQMGFRRRGLPNAERLARRGFIFQAVSL